MIIKDVQYNQLCDPMCTLDVYLPEKVEQGFKTFVFFHGGGLEGGHKDEEIFHEMGNQLSKLGICFVVPNYRKYPQVSYPDFIHDAAEAVAWVIENIPKYGENQGTYIGGHSAGGYLSMMLCLDGHYLANAGVNSGRIAGYIFGNGQPTAHYNVLKYCGLSDKRVIIDESAPIFHINEDLVMPKTFILVGEFDMENRLPQNQLLYSTLKHFGKDANVHLHVLENQGHCDVMDKHNGSDYSDMILFILKLLDK